MPDRNAKVVIVAPEEYYGPMVGAPDLEGQGREVAAVVAVGWRPVLLNGDVSEVRLGEALALGADGFWYSGHAVGGEHGGIALSDGILPIKALGQYLLRAGVRWVFLNSCDGADLVQRLQSVVPVDVYANIVKDVRDEDATRNAILFAQGIADGGSIRDAYETVAAGVATSLRLFPSPYPGGLPVQNQDHERRLQKLEGAIRRLNRIVFGDGDLGVPSWLDQTRAIDKRMRRIEWGLIVATILLIVGLFLTYGA